jgi:hypothetical protein
MIYKLRDKRMDKSVKFGNAKVYINGIEGVWRIKGK